MRISRLPTIALIAVVLGALGPVGAVADRGPDLPAAATGQALAVTSTSAVLTGTIAPNRRPTFYAFQYGTTTAYGTSTPVSLLIDDDPVAVSAPVAALQPSTTYHFRLVAADRRHAAAGADATFTTAAPPLGAPVPPLAAPTPLAAAAIKPPGPPVLGAQMLVAPVAGVVRVRSAAAAAPVALSRPASVPVGTLVDTRAGTARVTTAVDRSGRTQSVLLREGLAEVRQGTAPGGVTELRVRGSNFANCSRRTARAAAVTRRRPPRRTLWARDAHGRFRTRGRNSVATVRGTTWRTTDTCRGTTTTVTSGSVVVRDLRTGRSVLVRAGARHLARSTR